MSDTNNSSGGVGFCSLLAILFIGLKLTNYIDWSWYWVLAPIWIPIVIVIAIVSVFGTVWLVAKYLL